MKKITLIYSIVTIVLVGCQNEKNSDKATSNSTSNASTNSVQNKKQKVNINYEDIEQINGANGIYNLEIPKGLFKRIGDNEYYSDELNSKIIFYSSETSQIDDPNAIWEKKDLLDKMKQNLNVTYNAEKNDWVVVSGTNNKGEIVYKKGIYFKPQDNHMGENGRNTQAYCFTGVLEIIYPKEHMAHFDKLIPILTKSFKCDFLPLCANCIERSDYP